MSRHIAAIQLKEVSAPSTPPAGTTSVYAKADNQVYTKDEAGVERNLVGGNGTVLTVVALTQAAYDALGTKDPLTLYVVT